MKIEGKSIIELTDVNTGEVERYENTNMVTNALSQLLSKAGFFDTFSIDARPSRIDLVGGLFAFDKQIEENANIVYKPFDTNVTACASRDKQSDGYFLSQGSFNADESDLSHVDEQGMMKFVYDFKTSEGNGVISSLALTHVTAPYAHPYGDASRIDGTNSNVNNDNDSAIEQEYTTRGTTQTSYDGTRCWNSTGGYSITSDGKITFVNVDTDTGTDTVYTATDGRPDHSYGAFNSWWCLFDIDNDYIYWYTTIDKDTFKVRKCLLGGKKSSIFRGQRNWYCVEEYTLNLPQITVDRIGAMRTIGNTDGKVALIDVNNSGYTYWEINASLNIYLVDLINKTVETKTLVNTTNIKIPLYDFDTSSYNYGKINCYRSIFYYNNYVFVFGIENQVDGYYSGDVPNYHDKIRLPVRFNLTTGVGEIAECNDYIANYYDNTFKPSYPTTPINILCSPYVTSDGYMRNCPMRAPTGSYHGMYTFGSVLVYDLNNNILLPAHGGASPFNGNNNVCMAYNNVNIMYSDIKKVTINNCNISWWSHSSYDPQYGFVLNKPLHYLATINNLQTAVNKTADKTMKITYILKEVRE